MPTRSRLAAASAVATLLGSLAAGPTALAGTLQVRDQAHVLSADDTTRLRHAVDAMPFDARLVTTSDYADSDGLGRFVGSLVSEGDMIVVGVDPEHHHVQVHFGKSASIPRSAWPAIEHAGNDSFKRGDWEGGAEAIFRQAASSAAPGAAAGSPQAGAGSSAPLLGVGVTVLLIALLVGGVIWLLARRRSAGAGMGYGGSPYGGAPYGGSPYPGGPYPGGMPQQGGMGPLGGGLIGAGLGGIAGYELGKMEGERERNDYGGAPPVDTGSQGGDSFDAGGGGSSWDAGGGGSDFGGGDGGGGGGFDGGGGGGSDF